MLEWSYGRIYAAHLRPAGATYTAEIETVVQGTPLNMTDIEVTPRGSMFFITGGHNTQSTLYQIEYTNSIPISEPSEPEQTDCADLRAIRHRLESFHGHAMSNGVDVAWPYLGHSDRNIRYAARVALEFQPVKMWENRTLNETNPIAALTALLALSRVGGKHSQPPLLAAAGRFPIASLSTNMALLKLRVLQSTFIHQGRPEPAAAARVIAELSARFPCDSEPINREVCQLLLYLDARSAVETALDLAHRATTREGQMYYLHRLSDITNNWTVAQRKDYFRLLIETNRPPPEPLLTKLMRDAGREYSDGSSFFRWLKAFRNGAAKTMSDKLRIELDNEIYGTTARGQLQQPKRKFVRHWKMADFTKTLAMAHADRDFEKGAEVFRIANCIMCHRFDGKGASIGPELTAIGHRANAHDILQSILEPSNVLADQYRDTIFFLTTGDAYTGKPIDETGDKIVILTDPTTERTVTINKRELDSRQYSKVSPMPEGLVNHLTESEILDLIAYLQSGGNRKAPQFKQPGNAEGHAAK
jgi:putative heme-binding domain-containing protein